MAVQVVHSGGGPVSVNVTTTPAISVTSPQVSVVDVNPVYTSGQPGDTGPQGPQGPAGANGNDGATVTYTLSAQDGANSDEEKVRITGSNGTSSEVVLEAGTNLSIARDNDKITFASTVTNAVLKTDSSTAFFSFVVDEDTLSSNLNTKVPTQQSVKAYVDNNVTSANVTTNLATSYQTDRVTVTSSDGTDAVILEATGSQAGVMTVAMHDKLDGIASNADATNSTNVNAAGAIMHSDVAGSATGLITRAGSEQYTVVAASTSNISEGSNLYYTDGRADARVSAVIDTDNTLGSPSDTLVPSQAAIKTYVDNQLGTQGLSIGAITGTEVSINITGGGSSVTIPAATTSDAGVMTEAQFDKLAGIEANATADQTAAEIRTLVEAASDSNVFTDADHSKLDTIEANATADQTDAEIRAAVEAANDSNVFTDADHSKLNGIEANATADQTAAEIRALVEAATDSNVFTDADHSKLNGIEANATADQTNAEIRAAVEAASDSNVFTDADHDKLNAIESNANVTDSDNVVAALVSATSISGGNQTSIKSNLGITDPAATNNLSDVSTGGSANGQLLIYDAGTNTYDPANLTAGSNISITNGEGSITIASTASGGASSLNDLTDVAITGSGANKYLVRDSSNSNYINQELEIRHDGSPALGANLDVATHQIVTSASDRDIILTPNGTGQVRLGTLPFKADQQLSATEDNYVLTYDHAGGSGSKISLEPASTASGTVDTNGTPANNQVAVFTDADTIEGQSTFTFDSGSGTLAVTTVSAGNATLTGSLECQAIRATDDTSELSAIGKTGFGAILAEAFGNATTGLGAGKVCVLDNNWAAANAGATGTSITMLGVTTNADSGSMCLQGPVRVSSNAGFSSANSGSILYLQASNGRLTSTAPTTQGHVVRVCGYVLDAGNSIVYFNPSNDWIELA